MRVAGGNARDDISRRNDWYGLWGAGHSNSMMTPAPAPGLLLVLASQRVTAQADLDGSLLSLRDVRVLFFDLYAVVGRRVFEQRNA
jgi:hypothetical protein